MIKHVKGDIFKSKATVIVHQVNCQGVMGSGVAKQVRDLYPNVYVKYKELCDRYKESNSSKDLLGIAQIVPTNYGDTRYIANLFAQDSFGNFKCFTDYDALRKCLIYISLQFRHSSIAIPYLIGCCRGGGDWNIVYKIIEETLSDCDVTLYEYKV